jgi:hypothetical protein
MVVLSVEQYMLCGDIMQEIVEGCPDSEVDTLYEIYLEQLKAFGIPFEETADNVYEVPAEFAAWLEEVRNV